MEIYSLYNKLVADELGKNDAVLQKFIGENFMTRLKHEVAHAPLEGSYYITLPCMGKVTMSSPKILMELATKLGGEVFYHADDRRELRAYAYNPSDRTQCVGLTLDSNGVSINFNTHDEFLRRYNDPNNAWKYLTV